MRQGAQGWCTGKTQSDGMGREVGGGSGWGTHVNPWLIHVNVWQKPLQYCKVISLQLIKTNGKKKETKIEKGRERETLPRRINYDFKGKFFSLTDVVLQSLRHLF